MCDSAVTMTRDSHGECHGANVSLRLRPPPWKVVGGSRCAAMEGAAQELALCGTLAGLTDPDVEVLVALGWSATKLATLRGCRGEILDGILAAAKKKREAFEVTVADLRELVRQCDNRSANIHRADAGRGSQELLEAHLADQRAKRRRTFEGLEEKEVIEKIKMVGSAKVTKWPTRLGKKLHMAGTDLALRELAERTERDRWLSELRDIMKRAKLPVVARSSEESLLLRIAKGRRPNTLRKHVKTWHKVEQWLQSTYSWSWPTSPQTSPSTSKLSCKNLAHALHQRLLTRRSCSWSTRARSMRQSSYIARRRSRTPSRKLT